MNLTPTAIAQVPLEPLKRISLINTKTNDQVVINGVGVDVTTNGSGSFDTNSRTLAPNILTNSTSNKMPSQLYQLETVTFNTTSPSEGFVHFLIAVGRDLIV